MPRETAESNSDDRLQSWKEIATYLRFGVRTVQRWEETEGLPVYRRSQDRRSTVFAYKRELDTWYETRKNTLTESDSETNGRNVQDADEGFAVPRSGEMDTLGVRLKNGSLTSVPKYVVRISAVGFVVALLTAGALVSSHFRRADGSDLVYQLSILPPEGMAFMHGTDSGGWAVSPDGRSMVAASISDGTTALWLRSLASLNYRRLEGTEGAYHPFWSPDSRTIAFFSAGKLKKISAAGGAPVVLANAAGGRRGAWGASGWIVFTPVLGAPLHIVRDTGGESSALTDLDGARQENAHLWPSFLPDGQHLLFVARSAVAENTAVYVCAITGRKVVTRKRLLEASSNAAYAVLAGQGHLLFGREGVLWAQRFDARRLQLLGEPRRISENVGYWSNLRLANFSVSENGVLAFSSSGSDRTQLNWMGRDGRVLSRVGRPDYWFAPRLSADGTKLAVCRTDPVSGLSSVWLLDLARNGYARLTPGASRDVEPKWAPDGKRIVYASLRGPFALFSAEVDRPGSDQLLLRSNGSLLPFDWSRDGRFLVYGELLPNTRFDLWVLPLDVREKPFPILATFADELLAQFSPDSRWLVYVSDVSGRNEVYVRRAAKLAAEPTRTERIWQISSQGGSEPRWSSKGTELFYRSPDGTLASVSVRSGPFEPSFGIPHPLFPMASAFQFRGSWSYDVDSDGQRFLVLVPANDKVETSITVLVNKD